MCVCVCVCVEMCPNKTYKTTCTHRNSAAQTHPGRRQSGRSTGGMLTSRGRMNIEIPQEARWRGRTGDICGVCVCVCVCVCLCVRECECINGVCCAYVYVYRYGCVCACTTTSPAVQTSTRTTFSQYTFQNTNNNPIENVRQQSILIYILRRKKQKQVADALDSQCRLIRMVHRALQHLAGQVEPNHPLR